MLEDSAAKSVCSLCFIENKWRLTNAEKRFDSLQISSSYSFIYSYKILCACSGGHLMWSYTSDVLTEVLFPDLYF